MAAPRPVLRPARRVAGTRPYAVPAPAAPLRLDLRGNEGPAPDPALAAALTAARDGGAELLRRYPSTAALTAALAGHLGADPERLLVTAGGDDALDRLCRALLEPGRRLLVPVPAFEMTLRYARLAGATIDTVPWPGAAFPAAALCGALGPETALVALTAPNNPTGATFSPAELARVATAAAAVGAAVLVDLAYGDFADPGATAALVAAARGFDNTVILGTLSKGWGLAGLRVGWVEGPPALLGWMAAAGAPYAVSAPSLAIAAAALAAGPPAAAVDRVRRDRRRIEAALRESGCAVVPSQANFAFARSPRAPWLAAGLAGLGIGVRRFPERPGLEDALRIAVPADPAGTDALVSGLARVARPAALLLDMDGVMVDVSQSYRRAIVETAADFGVAVGPAEIQAEKAAGDANNDWVLTWRLVARGRAAAGAAPVSLDAVTAAFEARYQGTEAAPGLHEDEALLVDRALWAALRARLPIGIVTGRPRRDAQRLLDRLGVVPDALITMEDAPAKPDPAPVQAALAALGVDRAWMVGDTPDDVVAARAAGVVPLGICAPGDTDPAPLLRAGAARVLPALSDLLALLDGAPEGGSVVMDAPKMASVTMSSEDPKPAARVAEETRETAETRVVCRLDLDGSGQATVDTGLGFLDHMLTALARHGGLDLSLRCTGDLVVDDHHTAEDCALVLGRALDRALGRRSGIVRFGTAHAPLDEALARAVVDLSGRPWPAVQLGLRRERLGSLATENLGHFLRSLAIAGRMALHVDVLTGENDHHKAEAAFKAVALALRAAVARRGQGVPSTKGVLA